MEVEKAEMILLRVDSSSSIYVTVHEEEKLEEAVEVVLQVASMESPLRQSPRLQAKVNELSNFFSEKANAGLKTLGDREPDPNDETNGGEVNDDLGC